MKELKRRKYLRRTNDDVVDGNEDQFNEKSHESHHHESDRCTERHFRKFCILKTRNPNFKYRIK